MPDMILTTVNPPIITFTVNALLLFALGFAMVFANRLTHLQSK